MLHRQIFLVNDFTRFVEGNSTLLAQGLWHQAEPKVAVELQIEQGAVHIQQHGINFTPVKLGNHENSIGEPSGVRRIRGIALA
ncbi:hypothetical protein D3C72_1873470 [compost metagenome]